MREKRPFVLSIGGLDPSGGAGILSDVKTIAHLEVNGLAVSTCLTAQSHDEVFEISWLSKKDIRLQLSPLLNVYKINVCKIGVIKNWKVLNSIIDELLIANSNMKIILDPVLVSSSGFEFSQAPSKEHRDLVLSKVFLITPNEKEYKALGLQRNDPPTCNILLKTAKGESVGTDILFLKNGASVKFEPIDLGSEKHGSGCVLSSSISCYMALGEGLEVAISLAKQNIENYLSSSTNLIGTLNT